METGLLIMSVFVSLYNVFDCVRCDIGTYKTAQIISMCYEYLWPISIKYIDMDIAN